MTEFVKTGIAATSAEETEIRRPTITTGLFGPLPDPGQQETIHAAALRHGLPEIPGYYGYDFGSHQFIRMPFEQLESAGACCQ